MKDKESLRIRHCAFIIDKYTEKDLEKLCQVKEQIKQEKSPKFKFLTYVEDGNKVYGYSISGPSQLSFKNLRNILSAKATEAEMGDFKRDMDGKSGIKTHPHAHTHTHTIIHTISHTITHTQSHIHQALNTSNPTMTIVGMWKWLANTVRKEAAVMPQSEATSLNKDSKKRIVGNDLMIFWRSGLASQSASKNKSKRA
jgi:hypothetical protein